MPGGDVAVHGLVDAGDDLSAGGIGLEPGEGAAGAYVEGNDGLKTGDEALDLGVVEDRGVDLVAEEIAALPAVDRSEEIGGDVDKSRRDTGGLGESGVKLVLSQDFVGGDMEGMADGGSVAKESIEAAGEVLGVGYGPEGSAVTVDDDLTAATNAVDEREIIPAADGDGPDGLVGKGRADDDGWKIAFAVGPGAGLLAGDLVA